MSQSITQLEVMAENPTYQINNYLTKALREYYMYTNPISIFINKIQLTEILNKVKNKILSWTLELEEQGILGENMTFTKEEKETAKTIPQINNNNTVNNYGNHSNSQAGGTNNTIESNNDFTVEKQTGFQTQFNELKDLINQHQELSNNEDIQEDIHDITKQLYKPTPRPNKIINACNNILPLVKNIPPIAKAVTSIIDLIS